LSMGVVWGLFGHLVLRALRKVVRRWFYALPALGGDTRGFRLGGRSGFPGVGLGPLLAAPNGRGAPTARRKCQNVVHLKCRHSGTRRVHKGAHEGRWKRGSEGGEQLLFTQPLAL
jgi:hypothetical protein